MARRKNGKPFAGAKAARVRYAATQHRAMGLPSMAPNAVAATHGFTLKDAARNTAQHQWSGDKLRNKPVTFISAGMIEPLKEMEKRDDASSGVPGEPHPPASEQLAKETLGASTASGRVTQGAQTSTEAEPLELSASPAQKDSPAEPTQPTFFIDLSKDANLAKPNLPPPSIPDVVSSAEESDSSAEVILFKGRSNPSRDKPPGHTAITMDEISVEIRAVEQEISVVAQPDNPPAHTGPSATERHLHADHDATKSEEEDALIADYIANMVEDSEDHEPYGSLLVNRRDLGGDVGDDGDGPSEPDQSAGEAVSDDEGESLAGDSSADEDQSGLPDMGDMGPEIDDETLARLLSKQEELGMGGDELILSEAHLHAQASGHSRSTVRQHGRPSKATAAGSERFPSASAVADAFDDLDLMDWDRPSLHNFNKGKGGRRNPVFGVADPELEASMQATFHKDRERKKQRKLEREELRAQGLLGKHGNPDDLRVKYLKGMSLEEIKAELRAFLLSTDQVLQLPPMDKSARKILHELANKFNIKSNSTGSGDQRRPVLHRTKRTFAYVEAEFETATARVGRKYFPRLDARGNSLQKKTDRSGHAAVTYREGEIVGASAPELGQENKGRAMLEKMGWSRGMALGSLDNKGILQPVAHVVKRSKAGLGQT